MSKKIYAAVATALIVGQGCKVRKSSTSAELNSTTFSPSRINLSDEASSSLFTLMEKSNELLNGNFDASSGVGAKVLRADSVMCEHVVAPDAPFVCTFDRTFDGTHVIAGSKELIAVSPVNRPGILLLTKTAYSGLQQAGVASPQTTPPTLGAASLKASDLECIKVVAPNARAQCSIAKPEEPAASQRLALSDNASIGLFMLMSKSVELLGASFDATAGVGAKVLKAGIVTCSHVTAPSSPHLCKFERTVGQSVTAADSTQLISVSPANEPGILLLTKAVFEGMQEAGVQVTPSTHPALGATSLSISDLECVKAVIPNAKPMCTFQPQ